MENRTPIACIWTGNTLGFTDPRNGEQHVVPNTHVNYTRIKEAVKLNDAETAVNLTNLVDTIVSEMEQVTEVGDVKIVDGAVTYKGIVVQNKIAEMILANLSEGFSIVRYANFMANLLENPSFTSREQLHGFIEKYLFDITEDGRFYAYKVINHDWTSCYRGKDAVIYDNSVGEKPSMAREEVNEDPEQTCSRGLHVCGRSYIRAFMGGDRRLVMVAVNPRDVVAIPTDYQHAKLRCCEYEVIGEVNDMFRATETGEVQGRVVEEKQGRCPRTGRFLPKVMAYEPMPNKELDRTW